MHKFIILADVIMTLDNAQEQDDAADAIKAAGIQSVPVYEGGPDSQEETPYVMTAAGMQYACDQGAP
jgi:hypothetical protein